MLPAEAGEAASEGAGYARREKCLDVVEAARGGGTAGGFVKRQEALPALARRSGRRIVQQVCFGGETQEDGHQDARRLAAGRRFCREGIGIRYFPAIEYFPACA